LRSLDADSSVGAIVVTGSGRGFCSGADVSLLGNGADGIWADIVPPREDLPGFVRTLSTPVVAAANGAVAGIGFAYLMATDIRFIAAEARIATTFSRLGLVAEYGLSWLLPRLIGVGRTLDVLLTGRALTAAEAKELGLVEYVVPLESLLEAAIAYAEDLATNCSPTSLAVIKAQVYADLDRDAETALTDTLTRMDASFRLGDLDEALAARAEKRPPNFTPYSG
jgi:enoyl-CoA hydratase/carnithine racemase